MPRSLTMMLVTPLIGRLYNHVSPRILVGLGIIGVAWGSWAMGGFTLQTGVRDINVALIIQGVGFSLLFIPLTTVALSHIPRHLISDASGLNSLVRQFGGSVGLAIFTTFLSRFVVQASAALAPDVTMFRPEALARLRAIQAGMMAHGMTPGQARQAAIAALQGQVMRQSTVIAFDRTFVLGAILMVCLLPLLWFLRRQPHDEGPADATAHVEM
jgi:DHA2 family multidrug resistance protein